MVQATIVEIEKIVMKEEEVEGTRGLHMVYEEDIVKEMMMNLKMRLMTTASHTKFAAEPSMVKSSSGGSRSNFQGTFSGKNTAVPRSNQQHETLLQWVGLPRVVEFSASSVEAVDMYQESVPIIVWSL